MPSPITSEDFESAIPSANADFCTRFTNLLNVPADLAALVGYMFNSDGTPTVEFQAAIAAYTNPTGSLLWAATPNVGAGYLECNGQEVSRTTYADLYNAIGTRYGDGDGTATFTLPDFRGRSPMGAGQGAGLTNRDINTVSLGEERHTMTEDELVSHTHEWNGPLSRTDDRGSGSDVAWRQTAVEETEATGGGQPFNIIQPSFIAYCFIKI